MPDFPQTTLASIALLLIIDKVLCGDVPFNDRSEEYLIKQISDVEKTIDLMKKLISIDSSPADGPLTPHGYRKRIGGGDGVSLCSIKNKRADFTEGHWIVDKWHRWQVEVLFEAKLVKQLENHKIEFQEIHLYYCGWSGVKCVNEHVSEIAWQKSVQDVRHIDLRWLPPRVQKVHLDAQDIESKRLDTRMLPASIELLRIVRCYLCGTADFRTLPNQLKVIDLQYNLLRGTLWLTDLPRAITEINISENNIERLIIADIPSSLEKVIVSQHKRAPKVVSLDGGEGIKLFQEVA